MTIEERQYPIGKWTAKPSASQEEIKQNLDELLVSTHKLISLTGNLSEHDLSKTYREGGWTIRQLIHHLADTHLWHFIRLKHLLIEDNPTGFFANVNAFANTPDATTGPVSDSLQMILSTHSRYAYVFKNISEADYSRAYYHPFRQILVNAPQALDMVVWHLRHHLTHIEIALA
jgi:hypothetical protein